MDSRTTSSGYTVRLVAGCADNNQTVLVLNAQPLGHSLFPQPPVTDQFGRNIELHGGMWTRGLVTTCCFNGIVWPDSLLGARVRRHASVPDALPDAQPVAGDWTLQGTIPAESGRALPPPAPGMLDQSMFRFTHVEATNATVSSEMDINGPFAKQLGRTGGLEIPWVAKPHEAFSYDLVDASGRSATRIYRSISTGFGPAQLSAS